MLDRLAEAAEPTHGCARSRGHRRTGRSRSVRAGRHLGLWRRTAWARPRCWSTLIRSVVVSIFWWERRRSQGCAGPTSRQCVVDCRARGCASRCLSSMGFGSCRTYAATPRRARRQTPSARLSTVAAEALAWSWSIWPVTSTSHRRPRCAAVMWSCWWFATSSVRWLPPRLWPKRSREAPQTCELSFAHRADQASGSTRSRLGWGCRAPVRCRTCPALFVTSTRVSHPGACHIAGWGASATGCLMSSCPHRLRHER